MTSKRLSREKRTQRDYTLGFKLNVVSQVESGLMTYKHVQDRYGIQGRSTVLVWLRKYGTLDWSIPKELPMSKNLKETPEQKIKRLEKELKDERLRVEILNTMIDIADTQYGAGIRKKYSSLQSERSKRKDK